jgi:hypothetical protein
MGLYGAHLNNLWFRKRSLSCVVFLHRKETSITIWKEVTMPESVVWVTTHSLLLFAIYCTTMMAEVFGIFVTCVLWGTGRLRSLIGGALAILAGGNIFVALLIWIIMTRPFG